MKAEDLPDFYKNLQEEDIYFSYQGPLWQELLEELNDVVKCKIEMHLQSGIYSKCHSIFVEMIQNVIHYSASKTKKNSEMSFGIVVVGTQNNKIFILSGNPIDSYHSSILKKSLKELEKKEKSSLSELFRQQLRGKVHEKAMGAGLGLIDIFRRADTVSYSFSEDSGKREFFSLKVEVSDRF